MANYPIVTKELCMRCIYGYPCEMWDEREVPLNGEECPNFGSMCETEEERYQPVMNEGVTMDDTSMSGTLGTNNDKVTDVFKEE